MSMLQDPSLAEAGSRNGVSASTAADSTTALTPGAPADTVDIDQLHFGGQVRHGRRGTSVDQAARSAWEALSSNVGRAMLTTLGVIIGVAAVVVMISIGDGASKQVTQTLAVLGTNVLMVAPGAPSGLSVGGSTVKTLTEADAQAIAKLPGVAGTTPMVSGALPVATDRKSAVTHVQGTYPSIREIQNFTVANGGFFTQDDEEAARPVCVLGLTVAQELFGPENPVGQQIRVRGLICSVIGVLAPRGTTGLVDQDDVILMPYHTAQGRLFGQSYVDSIIVQAADAQALQQVQTAATSLLRVRHHLFDRDPSDFTIRSNNQVQDALQKTTSALTVLLAGIAGVSLIVGGIGIMNIMLVSVTERTREIGTRIAVGARPSDVLAQFLLEAILLSGAGGIIGLAIGALVSLAITGGAGWGASIDVRGMFMAFVFSVTVGIFFGYYPARRASQLDPIEALRRD